MSYEVQQSPGAARQIRSLRNQQSFTVCLTQALDVLESDPYNHSGQHAMRKLKAGEREGPQFRLRIRRFRFLYVVFDARKIVLLLSVSLRREDTYQ